MVVKVFNLQLPYFHHYYSSADYKKRSMLTSYGIICVSRDGFMVINKSPPYMKLNMKKNHHSKNFGNITVNTNEKYNLLLSAFPNSSLEGEYTLPKGRIDYMDKKNKNFTKVREFIEETKYTHPLFSPLLNKHYQDSNFKSFLNDENYILQESWLGLDNKLYKCEYSVFVIDSINELEYINNHCSNTVPFSYFIKSFNVYQDCSKYKKKYKQSSNLDSQKQTLFVPIEIGINLLNRDKINIDNNSLIQANDIYQILNFSQSPTLFFSL